MPTSTEELRRTQNTSPDTAAVTAVVMITGAVEPPAPGVVDEVSVTDTRISTIRITARPMCSLRPIRLRSRYRREARTRRTRLAPKMDWEVVPFVVEFEVAVPRLTPAFW